MMYPDKPDARYELLYWPVPFRGCFVSYLFAFCDTPLIEISEFDEISRRMNQRPGEQEVPFMGPPTLCDRETGQTLSQMPAIVLYVSRKLGLSPERPFDLAISLKILMDCNDILMEICRYNGSSMWERETWVEFRSRRFPHWLEILEASLARGFFGQNPVTFADIGVFALLGNMTRCLPQLDTVVSTNAPGVHALCQKIGSEPPLARYVAAQQERYGQVYCGGQIEQSIRKMLALDSQ